MIRSDNNKPTPQHNTHTHTHTDLFTRQAEPAALHRFPRLWLRVPLLLVVAMATPVPPTPPTSAPTLGPPATVLLLVAAATARGPREFNTGREAVQLHAPVWQRLSTCCLCVCVYV